MPSDTGPQAGGVGVGACVGTGVWVGTRVGKGGEVGVAVGSCVGLVTGVGGTLPTAATPVGVGDGIGVAAMRAWTVACTRAVMVASGSPSAPSADCTCETTARTVASKSGGGGVPEFTSGVVKVSQAKPLARTKVTKSAATRLMDCSIVYTHPSSRPTPPYLGEQPHPLAGPEISTSHHRDWLDAIRSGGKAGSDFHSYGGPLTEVALVGAVAIRFPGRELEWDAKAMQFTNLDEANAYVAPPYREGWSL